MPLFKDRHLNIAILISASWHLLCIFSVNPVLLPGHINQNLTAISFLGSILEKVSPVNEETFVLDQISLLHKMDKLRDFDSQAPLLRQPDNVSELIVVQPLKEQLLFSMADYNPAPPDIYHKKEIPEIKVSNFLIRGEAKDRTVLYRPDVPKIFILPSDFNSDYSANIRFRISRHGFIKDAECITSSGFSEIDQTAIRYIRTWQFVPSMQDNQEGIIRVVIESK